MGLKVQRGVFLVLLAASLAAAPAANGGDVGRHTLSNGITVITMPGEWNRIVAVSVMVDAGSKHDPRKLQGLAHLTNSLLTQGTTSMSALELGEYADRHGIRLGTELTPDFAHVYVTAIDSQFDAALEVLADVLQNPVFDERRLLEAQRIAHEALETEKRDPYHTSSSRLSETLFGKHPYAVPARGTEEGIDRVKVEHVVKFHRQRYVGGSTTIAIVGSFSTKHALERLEELLSSYPEGTAPETEFPDVTRTSSKTFNIFKDVDESVLAIGFVAPGSGHPDYAPLRVANTILGEGAGSRLQDALGPRGAGLTESVGSYCMCRDEVSSMTLYCFSEDPDAALEAVQIELDRLKTEPVTDEELTDAQRFMVGRHAISGQTNLVRAARMASSELRGLGYDFVDTFLEAVNRVDKDDIVRVASEWFKNPVTVVVRPGKPSVPPPPDKPKRAGI